MDHSAVDAVRGVDRRRVLGWGGLATAGLVAAGAPLVSADALAAPDPSGPDRLPPDTLPGGAYDRYIAELAAADRFSGVVLLSHQGRTVLSRSYGMADQEKGIRNHEGVAVNLGSAVKPFVAVAVLQLAQQGKVTPADPVGMHLTGFAAEIVEQVRIHHLLTGQWVIGRAGANAGSGANWNIYPDTGWVGVVLSNYDDLPLQEIVQQEIQAVTGGAPAGGGAGG